jgi:hypothetical protein
VAGHREDLGNFEGVTDAPLHGQRPDIDPGRESDGGLQVTQEVDARSDESADGSGSAG